MLTRSYPQKSLIHCLLLSALTSVGISKVHAEQINIYDGQPGHVVDGQQLDGISVSQDGTGIQIKDTTVNGRVSIINGANAEIDNLTLTCTTSNCVGVHIQGVGHIVGSAGTTTDFIGRGLNIDSNGTGLASSGSANIDLTDVTINATGNGLDLNGSVTKNDIANITKIDDFDITAGAHGVYAFFGAEVYLSNGTITTTSDNGIGAYLGGANNTGTSPVQTSVNANNVTLHTKGDNAYGIYSVQMGGTNGQPARGAVSSWNNSHIITEGTGSSGAIANYSWNTIELLNGSTVATSGDNAYGLWSRGGAKISLDNSRVTTQGTGSVGVYSYHYGNNYLKNGSSIETTGQGAHGAMVQYAGYISLEDSSILTKGTDAHGIYMLVGVAENGGSRNGSKVDLQRSSIVSEAGYGIAAQGGYLQVNVLDGSLLSGEAGLLKVEDYTGTGSPAWDQGITTVDIVVDGNSTISGHTEKTDTAIANITLKNGSLWQFGSDANLTDLVNDNSTITFLSNSGSQRANRFTTLTVEGNYSGNDGLIIMNTALNGDDSLTDKLIVNGDTSGRTYVQINNAGGLGDQTIEGIEVIQVKGDSSGSFEQQGRIVAGAYDYTLARGTTDSNSNNWYLTSKLTGDSDESILRPEAGSYLGNLVAANTMFNVRLHDRQGETSYIDFITGEHKTTSMWLRYQYGQNEFGASSQLDVTNNWYVTQLGGDIANWSHQGVDRLHVGIMAGYGRSTNDVGPNKLGNSSSGKVDGYSVGLYGTWYENDLNRTGLYVDSWLMWNHLNGKVDGEGLQSEEYKLKGFTASLEGGYTFLAAESEYYHLWLQPQGQLTWMGVDADNHTEREGSKISGKSNNLQTRLGLRTILDSNSPVQDFSGQIFIETNWLYNTQPFSIKMNGDRVYQSGVRNLAEIKGGIESTLHKNSNIWINLGYQFGEHDYRNIGLTLGMQVRF